MSVMLFSMELEIVHYVIEIIQELFTKMEGTIDISENSINNFILPKLNKGLIYE